MQYKIVIDKQSRKTPSNDKREYVLNIEELRYKDDIYDTLVINTNETYIKRKLQLSKHGILTELETPVIEKLEDLDIQLFEGDNYIYLIDRQGNKFYAEYVIKNDLTNTFATNVEMKSAINQTAQDIMFTVNRKVDGEEFGTYIQQNWEYVQYAWNQISEFIQLMVLNNKASFAILDENKNVMMYLDKEGQHFCDNEDVFGEMGIKKIDGQNFISFSIKGDYEEQIKNGMSWGITTKDGNYYPILYIRNFAMGSKNSEIGYGELELNSCNLVLNGFGTGIKIGGVLINGDPEEKEGVFFFDINNNRNLLSISPDNYANYANIHILDNIMFYKNQSGSNSLRIGSETGDSCLFTDDGYIFGKKIGLGNNIYIDGKEKSILGEISFYSVPTYQGNPFVYGEGHKYHLKWTGSNLQFWVDTTNVGTLSDKRLKTEIRKIDDTLIKAIKEIEIKQFKIANRNGLISFGILAQDLIKIFKKYGKNPFDYEIVYETLYKIDDNTIYYAINYEQFSILRLHAKEKEIESLQKKDKQKEQIINDLIRRIEILEKEKTNGNN